ncbi:excisionase family DNA binding protein [Salinibacter ruber]|uniref:helix-turn-helix domain-containing protein n=1 Tax=Salinibacter ruber TaxID=146919 RepID=UPI002167929D|nr:helix-turn-helix domain-containing protein [Salinibacter ruber]MCS4180169.1 excisionase family DNA binding protein [Salinibacter ruber]
MTVRKIDPKTLTEEEQRELTGQLEQLRESVDDAAVHSEEDGPTVLRVKDQEVVLPPSVARALVEILTDMAEGRPVSVASSDEELTTGEAAELLNVSRPHLVKLLEEGEIPFHKVGTHRRVYREDVLEYKACQRKEAEEAMQNLTDQAQELGLGY